MTFLAPSLESKDVGVFAKSVMSQGPLNNTNILWGALAKIISGVGVLDLKEELVLVGLVLML